MPDNYLITGYWGAPHVTAENDRGLNAATFGAGRMVLPVGREMLAEYIGNNTVRLYDGKLLDNGAAAGIPAGEWVDLQIANAGQGMKRNDLIVFEYAQDASTLVESGVFAVVQGAETSGSPTDPALQQSDLLSGSATFDQMALWRVTVSGGTIAAPERVAPVCKSIAASAPETHKHGTGDITGTWPINRGGTGATSAAGALTNLGITATAAELNYMDGVTSNVQTQLNGKAASSHGTHVTYSSTAPKAPGTASVGSAATVSRSDHVHPAQTTITGNAGSATKLQTARKIGDATFDGTANVTINAIGAATVGLGVSIEQGDNLDAYTTPGTYRSTSGTVSASLTNAPYTTTGFRLEVFKTSTANQIMQEIKCNAASARVYRRIGNYEGGVWSFNTWYQVLQSSNGVASIGMGGTGATKAADALANLGVQRGKTTFTAKASGVTDAISITFGKEYSSAPAVTLTPVADFSSASSNNYFALSEVTTTGFKFKFYHEGNNTPSITMNWIAVGTPA